MSQNYTVTAKDQIVYHTLVYAARGAVTIRNSSRWFLYVAVGSFANSTDIRREAKAIIPPQGERTFVTALRFALPRLTMMTSDQPYALAANIAASADVLQVSESNDPKVIQAALSSDVVLADVVIVAGGRVLMNQSGIYARDLNGNEVFAINLAPTFLWDGFIMAPGDVAIGRGSQYLYWDSSSNRLIVSGDINAIGGTSVQVIGSTIVFTPGASSLAWSEGTIQLSDGTLHAIDAGSASGLAGVNWISVDLDTDVVYIESSYPPTTRRTFGVFIAGTPYGSVFVTNGGTLISGNRIVTGSIVANNIAAHTITANEIAASLLSVMAAGVQIISTNIVFTPGSNSVAWSSGTVQISDGSTRSIASGSDTASGLAWIALSTNPAIGQLVILSTMPDPATHYTLGVFITGSPYGSVFITNGGTLISGNRIVTGSIVAGNIAANTITADKLSVSQLSAIAAALGTVTSGTIAGTTIEDAQSSPNYILDASGLEIRADNSGYLVWGQDPGGSPDVAVAKLFAYYESRGGSPTRYRDTLRLTANPDVDKNEGRIIIYAQAGNSTGAYSGVDAFSDELGTNRYALLLASDGVGGHIVSVTPNQIDFQAVTNPMVLKINGAPGQSGTVTIPKLTPGGANGSITFTNGVCTAFVQPT